MEIKLHGKIQFTSNNYHKNSILNLAITIKPDNEGHPISFNGGFVFY